MSTLYYRYKRERERERERERRRKLLAASRKKMAYS
jgi:hypothetical protein